MLSTVETELLAEIGIDFPWALIETFSTITREHPDNCNRAANIIAQRLAGHDVPVTMLEPTLLLHAVPRRRDSAHVPELN